VPILSPAAADAADWSMASIARRSAAGLNTLRQRIVVDDDRSVDDATLVARVRDGDPVATEALARRHMPAARAVALAIVADADLADDVAQDAFVAAIEEIDACRHPERVGRWIAQIARNRAKDALKAQRRRRAVPLDSVSLASDATSDRSSDLAELRRRLVAALDRLPEERRTAILLHDMEGWPHHEIAALLGLPDGTVRSHVHHARRMLRRLLGEEERP
jgi:RNA polymerase sigma-70 factor (ECF subfamily)